MSRSSVVSFAMRHNIPRVNRHHDVYYSRAHVDAIKEKQTKLNPDYYTYAEIERKYGLTTINISYYVNKYDILRFKQGSRTMVLRTEFDRVYREHRDGTYQPKKRESKAKPKEVFVVPEGYLSAEDIATTYEMTKRTACKICRDNRVPKMSHGGFNYYERLSVERLFEKYKAKDSVKEWMSAEQMETLYGLTPVARRSFAYRHKIPTQMVFGRVQYSRDHIEMVKSGGFDQRENYHSVTEAMEKYALTRDAVYNYCRYNKVRKLHQGNAMYLLREDFDRIMASRNN